MDMGTKEGGKCERKDQFLIVCAFADEVLVGACTMRSENPVDHKPGVQINL